MKLVCQKLGLEKGGRRDDGDQSKLKGDKAQVLRNQWGGGMDYNPAHPGNSHLSPWLRALWSGDYQAVMQFMDKVETHEINNLLEVRESLLNVSAVFHVIIGARTLCGKNPLFRDIQIAAARMMEVKNQHQKILSKLLELGADPDIKDQDAVSCRYMATYLPKISKLFSQADKRSAKKTRADAKVEAGGSLRLCKVCGVDDDNKRCTGCYMVWYCGQKCQADDWSAHKQGCKETKAQYKKVVLVEHEMVGM